MRVIISVTMTRSMMRGDASNESSQTLKILGSRVSQQITVEGGGNLRDGLVSTEENFGIILIESTLIIPNCGHVLDHDGVVRVLPLLIENRVRLNHVVDNVGLGDLFGTVLLLRAEVLAVVVAEVVVARNGGNLDARVDEEIDQGRLHLSLARLEIVASNKGGVFLGELDRAR